MNLLEAKNISINLGNRTIVENIDIQIHEGEFVGLIGPNGVGKSTLLKGLARLLPYQSGNVNLLGQSLPNINRKFLSRTVSYMAQGDIIYWPLKVNKIVSLGRLPHLSPLQRPSEQDNKVINHAMESTEVSHLSERVATKLSGGERRLVMLARALAVQAKILLVDEPVSGLDPNHQIQVMHLLKTLSRRGCSVLIILHDLSLAARYCDKLYLLHQGKMCSSGKPNEVLLPENLKSVYGITAKIGYDEEDFYVLPWDKISQ